MVCLYPKLGLFTRLFINIMVCLYLRFVYSSIMIVFVSKTGFIWFTHLLVSQTGFIYSSIIMADWVYLLVSITRLGQSYGVFVSDWFTLVYPSIIMAIVCIPDWVYLPGFICWFNHQSSCLYPRLGLFTPRLGLFTINHDGVFVSQTGFIYWFTHQS